MRGTLTTIMILLAISALADDNGGIAGGPWLGQDPPGTEPAIFAPGLVSTGLHERDILIHPDGRTIWYGVMAGTVVTVLEIRFVDDGWSEPTQVPFHTDRAFACFEPTLSADGGRVLFLTNRAAPGQEQGAGWANQNIFMARRLAGGGWSTPEAVPAPITTDASEYFPCLASDGTLYFTREDGETQAVWAAEPDGDRWCARADLLAGHGEPGGGSLDIWWVDAAVLDHWRP